MSYMEPRSTECKLISVSYSTKDQKINMSPKYNKLSRKSAKVKFISDCFH